MNGKTGKRGNGVSITAERIALLEAIGFEWSTDMPPDRSNLPQDSSQEIPPWVNSCVLLAMHTGKS
jgi:hypothetical protein